jgi:hypothetical protein
MNLSVPGSYDRVINSVPLGPVRSLYAWAYPTLQHWGNRAKKRLSLRVAKDLSANSVTFPTAPIYAAFNLQDGTTSVLSNLPPKGNLYPALKVNSEGLEDLVLDLGKRTYTSRI